MQATPTMMSVDEYRNTSFVDGEPEYVDGRLVERHVGNKDRTATQRQLIIFFYELKRTLRTYTFPDQHIHVAPTRFRIPDLCVYLAEPEEQIFRTPPFLVIEILSPDDRVADLQERIDDYLAFGVPFLWVIDPRARRGWIYTPEAIREAKDGVLRTSSPDIDLPLQQLFES